MPGSLQLAARLLLALAAPGSAGALEIEFDYSYDVDGYFATPARRAALDDVAAAFKPWIHDSLPSLSPTVDKEWSLFFTNPSTGREERLVNREIPADTLVIYVGSRAFDQPGTLAMAGPGGAEGKGTLVWENKVEFRGQDATGATNDSTTSTDFGPWGGSVAFTPDAEWHFGSEAPPPDRLDFRSAAIHELGHILGLGTSPSWERLVSTNASTFMGAASATALGETPSLNPRDNAHWAEGTTSAIPATTLTGRAIMNPSLGYGERKELTTLDWAGLADIGWQVDSSRLSAVPEPRTPLLMVLGAGCLSCAFLRRSSTAGNQKRAG